MFLPCSCVAIPVVGGGLLVVVDSRDQGPKKHPPVSVVVFQRHSCVFFHANPWCGRGLVVVASLVRLAVVFGGVFVPIKWLLPVLFGPILHSSFYCFRVPQGHVLPLFRCTTLL